jgi:hypothetical protein
MGVNLFVSTLHESLISAGVAAVGVSPDGAGYRVFLADGSSRLTTDAEVLIASKLAKIDELKAACQSAIESGFTSSTLGAEHTYESKLPQDQSNLIGAHLAGVDLDYTCIDAQGVKAQRFHTAVQMAQVFAAGMAHIQAQKAKFFQKKSLVEAATTQAEIDAISW